MGSSGQRGSGEPARTPRQADTLSDTQSPDARAPSLFASSTDERLPLDFATRDSTPTVVDRDAGSRAKGFANGRFEILAEVGSGGMGVVFKALQVDLGRVVAIKVLRGKNGGPASSARRERFVREARAAAKVKHPHVVPIYEIGESGETLFFTMELCEGETLFARLERGPIPVRSALEMMRKILGGLACAHEQGLVHRDLKPANIMLEKGDEPRIMDFGLAKELGEDPSEDRLTREGALVGTPHYMPPEQAAGRRADVDARSDVYACGVLLYEMVTGKLPFEGRSLQELLGAIFWNEPIAPRALAPDLPRDVEAIVLKALEKTREARYQTAREMQEDIARFLANEPVRAVQASPLYKLSRRLRQHRLAGVVALAVLAVAFAARPRSSDRFEAVSREVHAQARERIDALFGSAHRMLRLVHRRAEAAELPLDRTRHRVPEPGDDRLAHELIEVLQSWEKFSWVSYSTREGDFVGAYRLPGEAQLRVKRCHVREDVLGKRTVVYQYVVATDGWKHDWARAAASPTDYDPRTRPFYRSAERARGIVWTEPYVFWEGAPGITAAAAVRGPGGNVTGVVTIDLQTAQLSAELAQLTVGPDRFEGEVIIFTPAGELLANTRSAVRLTRGAGNAAVILKGAEAEDPLTRAFFAALAGAEPRFSAEGSGWHGSVRTIHVADLDIRVGVIVPASAW